MSDLGNEKIFAKNLKYYMEINNKTRYDVCRDLKLPYTTFAEWYNGKIYPRIDKIEMLANYFNIKKSDLIEEKTKRDILGNPVVPIPLVGTVKAGYDYLAQENWEGTIDLDKKVADTGEFFALKIKGDSMMPAFFEGDIVIIRKQNYCENNQFAVVIINGEEGTLKKVKKTDEGIILQPINPAYGPVMYTNKEIKETPIVIAGVFQELRRTEMKF